MVTGTEDQMFKMNTFFLILLVPLLIRIARHPECLLSPHLSSVGHSTGSFLDSSLEFGPYSPCPPVISQFSHLQPLELIMVCQFPYCSDFISPNPSSPQGPEYSAWRTTFIRLAPRRQILHQCPCGPCDHSKSQFPLPHSRSVTRNKCSNSYKMSGTQKEHRRWQLVFVTTV